MTPSSFEEGELAESTAGSGESGGSDWLSSLEELIDAAPTPTQRRLYRSILDTVAALARDAPKSST